MFDYEFSKSVLCHVQHISDWLVRVDRADGTILFSQHDLRLQAAVFALAESVMELCALLHREVVTERSQPRKPLYVGVSPSETAETIRPRYRGDLGTARRSTDTRPCPPLHPSERQFGMLRWRRINQQIE